jgi:hypothetical protein
MSLIQHSLVGHEHVKKWPYIISFAAKSGFLRFIYLALFFSLALLGENTFKYHILSSPSL